MLMCKVAYIKYLPKHIEGKIRLNVHNEGVNTKKKLVRTSDEKGGDHRKQTVAQRKAERRASPVS